MIATDMTNCVMKDEAILPVVLDKIARRRGGELNQVTKAVIVLANDDANYVTDHYLYVDRGWMVT